MTALAVTQTAIQPGQPITPTIINARGRHYIPVGIAEGNNIAATDAEVEVLRRVPRGILLVAQ